MADHSRLVATGAGEGTVEGVFGGTQARAPWVVHDERLTSIRIDPPTLVMPADTSLPVEATGIYEGGATRRITEGVTWRSSDADVIRLPIDPRERSRARALSPGTAVLSASYGDISATLEARVTDATLTAIEVTPEQKSLRMGESMQHSATGIFSDGSAAYVTDEAIWSTQETDVARGSWGFGRRGQITALMPGTTRVIASMGQISGEAEVTVSGDAIEDVRIMRSGGAHEAMMREHEVRAVDGDGARGRWHMARRERAGRVVEQRHLGGAHR